MKIVLMNTLTWTRTWKVLLTKCLKSSQHQQHLKISNMSLYIQKEIPETSQRAVEAILKKYIISMSQYSIYVW